MGVTRFSYGPVPSRRFGLSLGVDLVPAKTCSFDCVYCQVGRTTELLLDRRGFVSVEEVLRDVEHALSEGPRPDVITLAGRGDPTLFEPLGHLIDELRRRTGLPVVLLTNGALLFVPQVAADALRADILAPSLDAGDPETFRRVNRPHPDLDFDRVLSGLRDVTGRHPGRVQLEVMLVQGLNTGLAQLEAIARVIEGLRVDAIDINLPVRPAPGQSVNQAGPDTLEQALALFGPKARVVAGYSGTRAEALDLGDTERAILELIARRPCTTADIQASLGIPQVKADEILSRLRQAGRVRSDERRDGVYYYPAFEG